MTVHDSGAASSAAATWAASCATGAATTARSAPASASSGDRGRVVDRAALGGGLEHRRVGVVARDVRLTVPLRGEGDGGADQAGAEDGEPPDGHVSIAACGPGVAHQLGDVEGEVERLPRVQPRVAERHVVRRQRLLEHRVGAAEALGDGVAGELEVHAARPDALLAAGREEALDLVDDHVEAAGLDAGWRS